MALLNRPPMTTAGTNAYVNAGNPAALRLPQFTLELWIRRDGTGTGTDTDTRTGATAAALGASIEVSESVVHYALVAAVAPYAFSQSARNLARPMSVSGWS